MKNKDFSKISDILNSSVLTSKKFGQAVDKCMLFNFWKNVVGKKFEKISIPYDIKGTTLFVSVVSPVVLQEMSFFKHEIIEKYLPYAQGLNLKISDIKFNYKNWLYVKKSIEPPSAAGNSDLADFYTEEDLDEVLLSADETAKFEQLRESISNVEFLSPSVKEKMYKSALNQYKAQKLRKHTGKNQ